MPNAFAPVAALGAVAEPLLLDLPEHLDTPRLRLRTPRAGDGPAFHGALVESLAELRRFLAVLPWVAAEPTPDAAEAFCRRAQANVAARTDLPFLVFDKRGGELLGVVGLHRPVWTMPKAEVGYWCRSARAGRGVTCEAVQALAGFAFGTLGMVRLELITDAENAASRRVAEHCGFTLEGVMRHDRRGADGTLRDTCVYARLR